METAGFQGDFQIYPHLQESFPGRIIFLPPGKLTLDRNSRTICGHDDGQKENGTNSVKCIAGVMRKKADKPAENFNRIICQYIMYILFAKPKMAVG